MDSTIANEIDDDKRDDQTPSNDDNNSPATEVKKKKKKKKKTKEGTNDVELSVRKEEEVVVEVEREADKVDASQTAEETTKKKKAKKEEPTDEIKVADQKRRGSDPAVPSEVYKSGETHVNVSTHTIAKQNQQVIQNEEKNESGVHTFEFVQAKEFELLNERRKYFTDRNKKEEKEEKQHHFFWSKDPRPVAVAFSGGGIRASAYAMGALKGMNEENFLPNMDYLSTVSGGGFTGAAYISHLYMDTTRTVESAVNHLYNRMKQKCGYIVDRTKRWKMPIDIMTILSTVLFLLIAGKGPAMIVTLYPIGIWLHYIFKDQFDESFETGELVRELRIGFLVFAIVSFAVLTIAKNVRRSTTTNWKLWLATTMVRGVFVQLSWWHACLVGVWFLYKFTLLDSDFGWNFFIFIFAHLAFFNLVHVYPTDLVYLVYPVAAGYVISATWWFRIYWWDQIEWSWIKDDGGWRFHVLWICLTVALHLLNAYGKRGIVQAYWHYRLKTAFSDPEHLSGKKDDYKMSSRIAERVVIQKGGPYLICNTTLCNYRHYPAAPKYDDFTFSPLYSGCDTTGYALSDDMKTSISESMAISGAVFSSRMGKYTIDALFSNEYFLTLFGIGMGDFIPFPRRPKWNELARVAPFLTHSGILALIAIGVFLYPSNPSASWLIAVGFMIYLTVFTINLLPGLRYKGQPIFCWRLMAEAWKIVGVDTMGDTPPALLNLTDGGHLDNLGLIPLLKRECKLIFSFDAGFDPVLSCDELILVIKNHVKKGFKFMAPHPAPESDPDLKPGMYDSQKAPSKEEHPKIDALKAIDIFRSRNCSEQSLLFIEVTYPSKRKGILLYIKLRQKAGDAEKVQVPKWLGSFPHISTMHQFYTPELFDQFVEKGREDAIEAVRKAYALQTTM